MNNNIWRRVSGFAAACLGLWALQAWAQSGACEDPNNPGAFNPNLTPTQRAVCDATGGSNIIGKYGFNETALQQLSTQSDVRINTASLSTAAENRDVQCVAARRNGASMPGCPEAVEAEGVKGRRGAPQLIGPFGLTLVGNWGSGDEDDNDGETGFESQLRAATAIIDYPVAERFVAGISLGYQKTKLDFNSNSGSLDVRTYRGAFFANYVPVENAFLHGLIGFGRLDFDSERVCSACSGLGAPGPGLNPTRNLADYDGRQVFASIGGGYVVPIAAWQLGGYLRTDYARTSTDGYTETPTINPGNELQVESQRATSVTSALGVLASYTTTAGSVSLAPSARLEWVHEFEDDSRNITSRFVGDTQGATLPITIQTASPERNWVNLGINLRARFTRAFSGFVDYSHLFKEDASFDLVSAGLRYEF